MKKKSERKEIEKDLKLLAKASLVVFAGLLFSKIFTYIYRIIIARQFGPETYGLFTLSIMILGWFIALSSLGLVQGVPRYVAIFRAKNQKSKIKQIFRSSLFITTIVSIFAGIFLFLISGFIANNIFNEPGLSIFIRFFAILIPVSVILEIFLAIVRAYEYVGWYTFAYKFLPGLLKVILIIVFLSLGFKVNAVFFSYTLAFLGVLLASFFICKKKFKYLFDKRVHQKKEKKLFEEVLFYSWPLLFYGILWQTFHWTDSFIIGYFKTATDVGIYNAAVPIAFLLTMTSILFMQLFFPMITREDSSGNKETVKQLSKQVGKWIFAINIPITILFVVFPEFFIKLLFGIDYLGAVNSLRYLAIGTFFFSLFDVSNKIITMKGKSKTILVDLILVFILNVILNISLIPKYGIDGAAIATMISLIILSLIFVFQSYLCCSIIPIRRKILNVLIAATFATFALIYLGIKFANGIISSLIIFIIFLLFYGALILLFQGFDKNDRMIAKTILKKLNLR